VTLTNIPAASAPADEVPDEPKSRRAHHAGGRPNFLGGVFALIWLAIIVVPIWYVVESSLRSRDGYLNGTFLAFPAEPTLDAFRRAIDSGFMTYLVNTVIITFSTVAIVLLVTIPAAYAIARSQSRLVQGGFSLMLAGLAIPAQAVIVPLYLIVTKAYLYNTLIGVILPTAAFALPVAVLVLSNALRDVPKELYEAMTLDGGGPWLLLWRLVLPLARPAISTVGIYTAINAWNSFLFPLILTQDDDKRVLTLGLFNFQGQFGTDFPALLAAVLLSALPIFVIYVFGRRQLVSGLTAGAGK
jgi:ABC-type glycerol-3-phosphate transport system permease component